MGGESASDPHFESPLEDPVFTKFTTFQPVTGSSEDFLVFSLEKEPLPGPVCP